MTLMSIDFVNPCALGDSAAASVREGVFGGFVDWHWRLTWEWQRFEK